MGLDEYSGGVRYRAPYGAITYSTAPHLYTELQKRANRANQLVLIFPGQCYFLVKARGKKTVSSTNASMKVALVLAKTPVQPANNTSVREALLKFPY